MLRTRSNRAAANTRKKHTRINIAQSKQGARTSSKTNQIKLMKNKRGLRLTR